VLVYSIKALHLLYLSLLCLEHSHQKVCNHRHLASLSLRRLSRGTLCECSAATTIFQLIVLLSWLSLHAKNPEQLKALPSSRMSFPAVSIWNRLCLLLASLEDSMLRLWDLRWIPSRHGTKRFMGRIVFCGLCFLYACLFSVITRHREANYYS